MHKGRALARYVPLKRTCNRCLNRALRDREKKVGKVGVIEIIPNAETFQLDNSATRHPPPPIIKIPFRINMMVVEIEALFLFEKG